MGMESFKAQNLRDYVREEIEQVRTGRSNHISTDRELMARFGYVYSGSIQITLSRGNLIKERKAARMLINSAIQEMKFSPSKELASILGMLAMGGYVDTSNYDEIALYHSEISLLSYFKSIAESLFECAAQLKPVNRADGSQYQMVRFRKRTAARALGDLRKDQWPQTVTEKHGWIYENPDYLWGFLEGVFDISGMPRIGRNREVSFAVTRLNTASFLQGLMKQIGIMKPNLEHSQKRKEGIQGVRISNWRDLKLFASNIHSHIPTKEQALTFYREYQPRVCSFTGNLGSPAQTGRINLQNTLSLYTSLPQEKAWEVADKYWEYVQANPEFKMDIPEYYVRVYLTKV